MSLEQRIRAIFRESWYLKNNPDVLNAGVDAWEHFWSSGIQEGRSPNPLFDLTHLPSKFRYLVEGATIKDYLNHLHHVVPPNALFDTEWYLSQSKVNLREQSVLEHYLLSGADQGCEPCPLFVSSAFRSNGDSLTPLETYLADQHRWNDNIGPYFSGDHYLTQNADVQEGQLNPLLHFLLCGQDADRFSNWLFDVKLLNRFLPEAENYSQVVAALRSRRAITPAQVTPDPLARQLLEHAPASDERLKATWRTIADNAHEGSDPFDQYLSRKARDITLPVVVDPQVSVIVPTFNDAQMTLSCLEALAESSIADSCQIIVVDDGSDPAITFPLTEVKNLTMVKLKKNSGYSAAVTAGVEAALGEYIFLHNNDAQVLPTTLEALLDTLRDDDTIGAVGCLVLDRDLHIQEAGCAVSAGGFGHQFGNGSLPATSTFRYSRDVDYCSAVSLMLRMSTWDQIGGYSKNLQPAYYEDADLCMKIASMGKRIRYQASAVVLHAEGSSHGRGLHGSKAFQFRNRRIFADEWSSVLMAKPAFSNEMSRSQFAHAFDSQPGEDVLVVDDKCPDITTDAGSVRMAQIAVVLSDAGFNVHFVGLGGEDRSAWSYDSNQASIHWETGFEGLRDALRVIRTERPMVILSRPDVYARAISEVIEACPGAYIVYDTVDAHGLRLDREIELMQRQERSTAEKERSATGAKRIESLAINSSDCVISVSRPDTAFFRTINRDVPIVEIPMLHSPVQQLPHLEGRTDVLFVGGYRHPPNVDAALFAANEIMPGVWKVLPEARLILAGSHPPKAVKDLASRRVVVTGWLESLEDVYSSARVSLAPLRFGAGVNGKVTEALSKGIPVVTSNQSAEAADLFHEREVLIAADAETYAAHVVRLFREDDLWQSMSAAGVRKVAEKFSPEVARSALQEIRDQRLL